MRYGVSGSGDYFTSHLKLNNFSNPNSSSSQWNAFGMQMLGSLFDVAMVAGVSCLAGKGGAGASGGAAAKGDEYATAKQEYNTATSTIEVLDQKIQEYSSKSMTETEYKTKDGEIDTKLNKLDEAFKKAKTSNNANLDDYKKYSALETTCKEKVAEYSKTELALSDLKNVEDPGADEEAYVQKKLGGQYESADEAVKNGARKEFKELKAKFEKKQQLEAKLKELEKPLADGIKGGAPKDQLAEITKLKEKANGDAAQAEMTCEKYLKDKASLEAEKKQLAADYKSSKTTATMIESLQKERATAVLKQVKAEAKMKSLEQSNKDYANVQKELDNDNALKKFYKSHSTDANGNVTGKRNLLQRLTGSGKYRDANGNKLSGADKTQAKNARKNNANSANAAIAYDMQRLKNLS